MASVYSLMFVHIVIVCMILREGDASENDTKAFRVTAMGDVVIGGIFPVHRGVDKNDETFAPHVHTCFGLKTGTVALTLAMINAIEKMNQSPLLMDANVTLGYQIQDSCTDVSTGLRATAALTQQAQCAPTCEQPVVAVIGAAFSEMSIAVARQLTLDMIPQISYSSTSVTLSDKRRFPTFMRTVPNDEHQTAAMVRLLNLNGWNWVGIVVTDGDYGRSALERFASQASENGICIAFRSILPHTGSDGTVTSAIKQTAVTISQNPKAQVIVSFVTSSQMRDLYQELRNTMLRTGQSMGDMRRVWVASDSWSSSGHVQGDISLEDIGHVVGFNFKTGNLLSFYEYLNQVETTGYKSTLNNPFLEQVFHVVNESSLSGDAGLASEVVKTLKENTNKALTLSTEMAVSAVAQAVASICRSRDCKAPGSLQPWEVLEALWNHEFEHQGRMYAFDNQGDINQGYDVTMWTSVEGKIQVNDIVAEYLTHDNSFTVMDSDTAKRFQDLQQIFSKCSNSCIPGEFKKTAEGQHTCCYECINCTENYFSNNTDMDQCLSCDITQEWSPKGSSTCLRKRRIFFSWHDRFAVVLLTFSSLGIVLVLMVSALFVHQRNTPVVKASGGPLNQVILFSLVVSFISAVLFVGKPNHLQCKMRQVLFGISFTLCVSCILVKSLKILLAFQLNINVQGALRKVYQSVLIIVACVGVQAAICISWLVLKSPYSHSILQPKTILEDCYEGSYLVFGVMLGYIALLAFVCFVCAFIGRKLPQQYNEARFITFSMLLYLISWLLFIPVYITTSGVYLPAVEMVIILMSNYGILGCHFFPKCYIMLFRKDQNTCSAFREKLYQYTVKRTDSFSVSGNSVADQPVGVQTISPSSSFSLPKEDTKAAVEESDSRKVSFKGPINGFRIYKRSISL
uniref:G-protein coupled receptor family C group 6 member A n=1 Tax=Doryrhamphus excisus TaxID=161450 RepID=UPI0025AEA194|nr:G-protein coupled receptor family C group 6 member A [Doryrhamphus excisus]